MRTVPLALYGPLLLICSCAAAQDAYWENSTLSADAKRSQFPIDRGNCVAVAHNTAGPPPAPPQSSSSSSTFSGIGPSGPFQGQITTTPMDYSLYPYYAYGQAQAQHQNTLEQVFVGCMAQRGWIWHPAR